MTFGTNLDEISPPILSSQQFTVADVLAASNLSAGQLKGILDRKQITLSTNHNPGTGRRRMFTGQDIIALSAVQAAGRVGFPLRWGNVLAQQVVGFAGRMHIERIGGIKTPHLALAFYPSSDGEDWAFVAIYDGEERSPLPTAFQILDVTKEVGQTLAKLQAIVEDKPLPDFSLPDPKLELNPYSPASNFFRAWEKSENGRWIYVGLSEGETDELLAMQGSEIQGDELVIIGEGSSGDRYLELHSKHERVRLQRCGFDMEGEAS